jgi:hypothetical protein
MSLGSVDLELVSGGGLTLSPTGVSLLLRIDAQAVAHTVDGEPAVRAKQLAGALVIVGNERRLLAGDCRQQARPR